LGNWVAQDRAARQGTQGLSSGDIAELKRLRAEVAELRMERDVLIGLFGGGSGRVGGTSGDVLALEVLLETGAVRRVRPAVELVVAQGRSWSEPARGMTSFVC
jgi:hypothetical protein